MNHSFENNCLIKDLWFEHKGRKMTTHVFNRELKVESISGIIVFCIRPTIEVNLSQPTCRRQKAMLLEIGGALRYHFILKFYPCVTVAEGHPRKPVRRTESERKRQKRKEDRNIFEPNKHSCVAYFYEQKLSIMSVSVN